MKTYARIDNGIVMEIITPLTYDDGMEIPIEVRFPSEFVRALVDVSGVDPMPGDWWLYNGDKFSPPDSY
ncbi:hypothetical protein [Achromobacter xylosoxidans]|uniref:hypothetical protein n=1 Tax=Alcaligenes xylosoxydans xylosoxydans TaxID=85698 RepID=UPI001F13DF4B|nr:hypothetical protein [Achromobacter xylosoxidans]